MQIATNYYKSLKLQLKPVKQTPIFSYDNIFKKNPNDIKLYTKLYTKLFTKLYIKLYIKLCGHIMLLNPHYIPDSLCTYLCQIYPLFIYLGSHFISYLFLYPFYLKRHQNSN